MVEEIVVYLHGNEARGSVWYRVVLVETVRPVTTWSKGKKNRLRRVWAKEKRETISLAVVLCGDDFGFSGGWAVIEDDIYVAGGWFVGDGGKETVYKDLVKHNIHSRSYLLGKSISLKTPCASPFLAAVGRKLSVLSGTATDHDADNSDWTKCGEIYDLDNQTLDYLTSDIKHFDHYITYDATTTTTTTVLEDQTQIVFYSLVQGSMLILDTSTGDIVKNGDPDHHFALRSQRKRLPRGLQGGSINPCCRLFTCSVPQEYILLLHL